MAGAPEIDGYTDLVEIGHGGQAVVYRATQVKLGRQVAIKVLNEAADEATLRQFRREGEAMVALGHHPHLLQVFDVDATRDGRLHLVMELCARGSASDQLRQRGPLPVDEVLEIGIAVADALAAIHDRGYLHRDVKPQNILLSDFGPRLADFGIARPQDLGRTTMAGALTVAHAAPEVLNDEDATVASDLWSLGSTLHTLLTGRSPFAGTDTSGIGKLITRALTDDPNPIDRDDVPEELTALLEGLLDKAPGARPSTAREVHNHLRGVSTVSRADASSLDAGAAAQGTTRQVEAADETVRRLVDPTKVSAHEDGETEVSSPLRATGHPDTVGTQTRNRPMRAIAIGGAAAVLIATYGLLLTRGDTRPDLGSVSPGESGGLLVNLEWNGPADLDLELVEPDGSVIRTFPGTRQWETYYAYPCEGNRDPGGATEMLYNETPTHGRYVVSVTNDDAGAECGSASYTIWVNGERLVQDEIDPGETNRYDLAVEDLDAGADR